MSNISLGDSQSYLLTTAENDLGVIYAESEAGKILMIVCVCVCVCVCEKSSVR